MTGAIITRMAVPLFLALCLVLGGASNAGFLANFALQMMAIALGVAVLVVNRSAEGEAAAQTRALRWLAVLMAIIAVLQFVPLPLSLWSALPGRAQIAQELAIVGVRPNPAFVTLSYHETIASLVWLLPAAAMALVAMCLQRLPLRNVALVIVAAALVGIVIGLAQFAGGQQSPAYIYDYTTRGASVGFFANANHMVTMLLASLPFLSATTRSYIAERPGHRFELVMAWAGVSAFILLGIALARSLTGFALAAPVLALSALILFPQLGRFLKLALIPALVLGVVLVGLTGEGQKLLSGEGPVSERSRQQMFVTSVEAARSFWPVGSGLGTFREVYDDFEDGDAAGEFYVHHAHSEYLELVVELGLAGLVGIIAFLAWWGARLIAVWRMGGGGPFVQAAAIASGVILLHSAWDYPLRTAAISVMLALCCAILARARVNDDPARPTDALP